MPVGEIPGTPYLCVQWGWQGREGRRWVLQGSVAEGSASGAPWRCGWALPVPSRAGIRAAAGAPVQQEGSGGGPFPAPDGAPRQDLRPRLPPGLGAISTRRR